MTLQTKTNFRVKTQAAAYAEGARDAYDLLVTLLVECGDINYLLEGIENNAAAETVERMNAYYAAKNAPKLRAWELELMAAPDPATRVDAARVAAGVRGERWSSSSTADDVLSAEEHEAALMPTPEELLAWGDDDGNDEPECEGHESFAGDSMGASTYCDGSCI
jgi:hypothetical protein